MSNPNSTEGGNIRHAKVAYPKPQVWRTHPFNHPDNHAVLLEYLQQRLTAGKKGRDGEIPRLVRADRKVSGWIQMSAEDKKRDRESDRDGKSRMKDVNLPLSFVHLDDMMTYFAQTFAPNRGMFYQTGAPDEQDESKQIVTKMNNDAIYSGYFREVLLGIFSLLKYNLGGYEVQWGKESGPKLVANADGTNSIESELKWQGNRMKAIDRYNFLFDTSVPPSKLYSEGEFAATVEVRSRFWLQNKASQGAYYNCTEAMSSTAELGTATQYYRSPPAEARLNPATNDGVDAGQTNWVSILSESPENIVGGHELTRIFIRLNPTEFGLVDGPPAARAARSRYEIWRFTILDDKWIIDAEWMNNMHNHIPFYLGLVHDDGMGPAQKSVGELLEPLQDFASALMNIHIAASRSALWGVTFYDPTVIPMGDIPEGEVSARVPIKPTGYGKSISDHVWQHSSTLETKQTMGDLESVMGIINQFFPTQALPSQIASIDRAVSDQVAAVQQGANRRQQKTARLIDDSIFRNVRFAMYYNIIQYQPSDDEMVDYYTGKEVKLDIAAIRRTNLPFIIGQGLKAIDRTTAASQLQSIIFALIQAPQASQGIDLLGLIDYWTSMMDIDIDMRQFRLAPPPAAAGPDGQPVAAGGTDAAGAPIQPATNPAAVTTPIYGS